MVTDRTVAPRGDTPLTLCNLKTYVSIKKPNKKQLRAVDHSARGSMKNAANCVN